MVTWNYKFSVGVRKLDQQHIKLFDMVSDLMSGSAAGYKEEATRVALDGLAAYAREHFADEEKAMASVKYAGLETHIKDHQKFIQALNEMRAKFESDHEAVNKRLLAFVEDWITNHVQTIDKQYAPFLKGKV